MRHPYIYIYIYMYGHNLNQSARRWSKFQNFPQFYRKDDPENPPHLVWGFFTFQCFVFFLIFAFSCFSYSSSPLLLDFLKPKSGPSNEVLYIYIYIIYAGVFACRGLFLEPLIFWQILVKIFVLSWGAGKVLQHSYARRCIFSQDVCAKNARRFAQLNLRGHRFCRTGGVGLAQSFQAATLGLQNRGRFWGAFFG